MKRYLKRGFLLEAKKAQYSSTSNELSAYLSYDPNFTDNMEEDTDDEGHEEEEDDESANEYTDDEDASWKVRIAAAKCLAALIVSRPELLSKVFDEVWFLMRRFDQPQKYKPFINSILVKLFHFMNLFCILNAIEIEAQGSCGRLLRFGLNFGSHSSSCICRVQGVITCKYKN
ncbi:Cullin-associated NEDD8-dissociated protein 1 [Trifolium repens]|nr:Cullin-associated NEDD8-dissociated protein 1 [Trifolium repens]